MTRAPGIVPLLALCCLATACERRAPAERRPYALPVSVSSDTSRTQVLHVSPPGPSPGVSVWLARVSPARIAPAAAEMPAPEAAPETLSSEIPPPPALAVDEDLKPPIPRGGARLAMPAHARRGVVEMDVRVDEQGRVSDAMWAGGSDDSSLVHAATECALDMSFFPALRAGRPVAVWCRQRFDFGDGVRPER